MSQKKPIIFHLITGLGVGGAEKMLLKTLPLLQGDYSHQVLCLRGEGSIALELKKSGIQVHFLQLNFLVLPAVFRFRKLLASQKPSLLVLYLIHADIFGRIFGKLLWHSTLPVISNRRGFYLTQKKLWWLDNLTAPLVDHFVVQTNAVKLHLEKRFHLPEEKFTIIPNCIDLSQFPSRSTELRDELTIISVATLKPGKGFEELFEAYEHIFTKHSQKLRLLIVGDGPELIRYQEQIKNYESKSTIEFFGNRDDVPELLSQSDIFVLATHSEGMSNSLLEAMAAKLPIITTDIEANQEILKDRHSALLVPVHHPKLLAKALEELLLNSKLRATLGAAAHQTILERFSQNQVLQKIDSLYQKFIKP